MRIHSNKEGFSIGHLLKCLATVVSFLFFMYRHTAVCPPLNVHDESSTFVILLCMCLSFVLSPLTSG